MTQPITAVLLGAGARGHFSYGPYAQEYPDQLKFVAVAEPNPVRRERFAQAHGIPPERQFATWEDLLAEGQIADALFNMTQDQTHYLSTLAAFDTGYHVLLEKPMAERLSHVVELVQAAERAGKLLQVCHVLRFSPFFSKLHEILDSGRLGEIITVEHRENVVYWHMAHSYVRGNWRNFATLQSDDPGEMLPRPRRPLLEPGPEGGETAILRLIDPLSPRERAGRCDDALHRRLPGR